MRLNVKGYKGCVIVKKTVTVLTPDERETLVNEAWQKLNQGQNYYLRSGQTTPRSSRFNDYLGEVRNTARDVFGGLVNLKSNTVT